MKLFLLGAMSVLLVEALFPLVCALIFWIALRKALAAQVPPAPVPEVEDRASEEQRASIACAGWGVDTSEKEH